MYAGVSNEHDINSVDIPEWKKLLIMRKRAGNLSGDEQTRSLFRGPVSNNDYRSNVNTARNGGYSSDKCTSGYANKFTGGRTLKPVDFDGRESDSARITSLSGSPHEATPPKIVTRTIGNINVELRSVSSKSSVDSPEFSSSDGSKFDRSTFSEYSVVHDSDDDGCEDLQYGPGIVDRLRARFLNMGAKKPRKPVVRRFSSLENLPGSQSGPYRPRGMRQNGKFSGNFYNHGHVKKAQSMETLLSSTPTVVVPSRRTSGRFCSVKGRIISTNASTVSVFADENDEPEEDCPSPILVSPNPEIPHLCNADKTSKRWEYTRSVSAPSINENELPKPDTVKQVKKIFESSPVEERSNASNITGLRIRKVSGNVPVSAPSNAAMCNGAILGNSSVLHTPPVKIPVTSNIEEISEEVETAKFNGAKEEESDPESVDCSPGIVSTEVSPTEINESYLIDKRGYSPVSCDELSPTNGTSHLPGGTSDAEDNAIASRKIEREESEESFIVLGEPTGVKVTHERPPFVEQISVVDEVEEAQFSREETGGEEQHTLVADIPEEEDCVGGASEQTIDGMVVASSATDAPGAFQKPWQAAIKKPPQSTTSIVFDFRGKDVKPNISLNPTPFGCRPAKVSRRAGSPPRGGADSPDGPPKVNGVKDYLDDYDDDEWDEMDIGADLPAICGISFDGENVKVGRGALLETRNKKLTIQFDDGATSTFEYPSEVSSPGEENGYREPPLDITSPANSRLGLSNYTPHVLSSSEDFELGVSRLTNRPFKPLPKEPTEDIPQQENIVPAEEATGWSASETTDILF